MKQQARAVLLAAVSILAACQDASTPLQPAPDQPRALIGLPGIGLPGIPQLGASRYIVVFRNDVADPLGLSRVLVARLGGRLLHTYQRALKGFAAVLPDLAVATLRLNPLVAYVESDKVVRTSDTQSMDQSGDPWGLDRIDQQAEPLSGTYSYTSAGAGVHAYIIDTGIWTLHPDFGGRADNVYDALTLGLIVIGLDCNGHGTHVAGTVGGATYGVAKEVQLHGVRVLGCAGTGFNSDVLAGVDWVAANHERPAVANMSLGGDFSRALNDAVTALSNAGVFIAVAAGNDDEDACGASPASAAAAFTVAASERGDAKSSFSNWGTCVDAYAPGATVKSAWLLGAAMTFSGTSMASPHVAGTAALYKATFGDAPSSTVADWITSNATAGVITGNPDGTPNLLLYKSDL
jgi:subtilisin family serine protease